GAVTRTADREGGEPGRGGGPVGGGHGRLLRGDGRAVRAREVGAEAGHRVTARRRASRIPTPTTTASSAAPTNHATLAPVVARGPVEPDPGGDDDGSDAPSSPG